MLMAAPEIINEQPYDYKVDCWSLGIMLYEFLSGEYPFNASAAAGNETELFNAIKQGKFTFNENWDSVSPEAKDLVQHLLELNPEKRYSMKDVINHPWMQLF